jgi:chromosome segregation ATPase
MTEELHKFYDNDLDKLDFEINEFEIYNQKPFIPTDASSRALTGAMKALQEKIKYLESDLHQCKEQMLSSESKYSSDREKWQTRLLSEIQMSKERETLLQTRLSAYASESQKLQQRLSQCEEQLKIKDIQCKFSESEGKRNFEQFSVDVESLTLQIEYLQKSLSSKTTSEQKLQKALDQAIRDKDFAEEELKQQKRINSGLQSEVNFLRENSEFQRNSLQKNYQNVESELTAQNQEFLQKIKELEVKNKSLRDLNHNQSQQISHLKKEITEMNKMNEEKTLKKIDLIKTKTLQKKPPVKVVSKRRSASPKVREVSQLKETERKKGEEDFKKQIVLCEKEIDRLSSSYKDLICLTSSGSADLNNLRKEMTRLASDIEKKNEELYEYKKRQQDFLRDRLYN